MQWLNYHHLLYFWVVARDGSITRAARELRLAKPTISAQIQRLEAALGHELFERQGRRLVLTDAGRVAYRYADEIFSLGRDLVDAMAGRPHGLPLRLVVGVADVLPKPIVRRLLEPVLHLDEPVHLVCREDRSVEDFMGELASHAVDVVLADRPLPAGARVRAFSRLIGECGTTFFAAEALAARCAGRFPKCLDGMPCLLPGAGSTLRRALDQWLSTSGIRPTIVAEFDDAALLNVFGRDGLGFYVGPTVIEGDIRALHGVQVLGRAPTLRQRFYALSMERRLKHPAVIAICESARAELFA